MEAEHDRLTVTIPSHPQYLCVLRGFFGDLLAQLGFNRNVTMLITLAIHEACANAIEHAYHGDTRQRIDLTVDIDPANLTVEIQDYGKQTDVAAIKPRPLDEIRPGGLGTHFIRSVMDDVVYNPMPDVGTLLRMTKRRSSPCASP